VEKGEMTDHAGVFKGWWFEKLTRLYGVGSAAARNIGRPAR
jgi:hypothetical protein